VPGGGSRGWLGGRGKGNRRWDAIRSAGRCRGVRRGARPMPHGASLRPLRYAEPSIFDGGRRAGYGPVMGFVRHAVAALVVVLLLAPAALAQEVTLSVAISLKDAVEDLGRQFMASRPGVTLRYNFGASGDLQKQIEAGAPRARAVPPPPP